MSNIIIPFRVKLKLASLSAKVVGKFRSVWKNTRLHTRHVIKTYKRIEEIANILDVKKPKPLVKMEEE